MTNMRYVPNILWKSRKSINTDQGNLSTVAPSNPITLPKLLQSAEPVGMAWRRRSMSLGLYTVWEVLGRGWDPAPGQNGKLHHCLNLGTMDRRDPDVEPTELGQPNALQSLDWENPLLADNPLPLTLENIAGRAKGQSARRWTHHVTPRRVRV